MAKRGHANRLLGLGKLVDDAVGADAQAAEPSQTPTKDVSDDRIAFEQSQRVMYGVDERPVELE